MANDSACPYCGVILDPFPKRSRKCPNCREPIVLRTEPTSKTKLLLTKSEADEFDRAKKARSLRNRVLANLEEFGLNEGHYTKTEKRLTKEFGRSPSAGDVFWRLANERIERLGRNPEKNAHDLKRCYWSMGLHLLHEGRSREAVQNQQRESHRWALIEDHTNWRNYGSHNEWIPIVDTSFCCETCGGLNGVEYTYEEALAKMPLPQADCEEDWCLCGWSKRISDDLNDTDLESEALVELEEESNASKKSSPGCLISLLILSVLVLAISTIVVATL